MNDNEELPRWDLRERQVRRFEQWIGQAVNLGKIVIEAKETASVTGKGMNSRTLYCRIKDGILGFKRYGYPSKLFNAASGDLDDLAVRELVGERVEVYSKNAVMRIKNEVCATKNVDNLNEPQITLDISVFIGKKERGVMFPDCPHWLEYKANNQQHAMLAGLMEDFEGKVEVDQVVRDGVHHTRVLYVHPDKRGGGQMEQPNESTVSSESATTTKGDSKADVMTSASTKDIEQMKKDIIAKYGLKD